MGFATSREISDPADTARPLALTVGFRSGEEAGKQRRYQPAAQSAGLRILFEGDQGRLLSGRSSRRIVVW